VARLDLHGGGDADVPDGAMPGHMKLDIGVRSDNR
jgi:hypothetical protein